MTRAWLVLALLVAGCQKERAPTRVKSRERAQLPACASVTPHEAEPLVVPLVVVAGPGVHPKDAQVLADEARAFFRPYGVALTALGPRPTEVEHAIGRDPRAPFAPAAALISSELKLVVLHELIDPSSDAKHGFERMDGITKDTTAFVSLEELKTPRAKERRFTAPHELGHALGLVHVRDRGNLMNVGWFQCVPHLTPEQGERVRDRARALTNAHTR